MSKLSTHNQTLVLMLIFTIISSAIAFGLVIKAYDTAFALEFAQ